MCGDRNKVPSSSVVVRKSGPRAIRRAEQYTKLWLPTGDKNHVKSLIYIAAGHRLFTWQRSGSMSCDL